MNCQARIGLPQTAKALIAKVTAHKLPGYDDAAEIKKVPDALAPYRRSELGSEPSDSNEV
jgi:hypothetical protein